MNEKYWLLFVGWVVLNHRFCLQRVRTHARHFLQEISDSVLCLCMEYIVWLGRRLRHFRPFCGSVKRRYGIDIRRNMDFLSVCIVCRPSFRTFRTFRTPTTAATTQPQPLSPRPTTTVSTTTTTTVSTTTHNHKNRNSSNNTNNNNDKRCLN